MDWKHLLAYITETVDQELLLRSAYLVTENRILRNQRQGRVRLSDGERQSLAEIAKKLGRQALEEIATIVKPDAILAWHRKLIARNVTMADWGFLQPGQYLIHDRDGKFCPAFHHVIDEAGLQRMPLPPRSPNLNT